MRHPTAQMELKLVRQTLAFAHNRRHFIENRIDHAIRVHCGQRLGPSAHVGLELSLETELLHPLIGRFLPLNAEHHSLQHHSQLHC